MATIRQQKAFDILVGNGGTISVGQAMIQAGLSPNTANTPQKLTESKGWKELMEKHLSDDKLAKAHNELLNQKRLDYFVFPKSMNDEEVKEKTESAGVELIVIRDGDKGRYAFYATADAMARKGALEMAYKLKGAFAPEKSLNLNIDVDADSTVKEVTEHLNEIYRGASISGYGTTSRTLDDQTQDQERDGDADRLHQA